MKVTSFLISWTLLVSCLFSQQAWAHLCDDKKGPFQLSSEPSILLPFCGHDVNVRGFYATADYAQISSALGAFPLLYPVKTNGGRAIVLILSQEYKSSDIGPYDELILAAMVSKTPDLNFGVINLGHLIEEPGQPVNEKPVSMALLKVLVNSDKAKHVGNSVWDMKKEVVHFITKTVVNDLYISSSTGEKILEISGNLLEPLDGLSLLPTLPLNFSILSQGGIWAEAQYSSGYGYSVPILPNLFNPASPFRSYLTYGSSHGGQWFEALDLVPKVSLNMKEVRIGVSAPKSWQ